MPQRRATAVILRVVGVSLDSNALPWKECLQLGGDRIENLGGLRDELCGTRGEELVARNRNPDSFTILADGNPAEVQSGCELTEICIRANGGSATHLRRGLHPTNLRLGIPGGDFRDVQLLICIGKLLADQIQLFAIDLRLLLALGQLRMKLSVVVVQQVHAAAEFRKSGVIGIDLLPDSGCKGSRLGWIGSRAGDGQVRILAAASYDACPKDGNAYQISPRFSVSHRSLS